MSPVVLDSLCPFSGPQCLIFGWFIGFMITCGPLRPRALSSYPQNPEIRHLPYLDHEGKKPSQCQVEGSGTVSKLWGDKWQSTPGYCTLRPYSIRTTRFQGAGAFKRRAGQRPHFHRGKAQAPPSPDTACCRDQVGDRGGRLLLSAYRLAWPMPKISLSQV